MLLNKYQTEIKPQLQKELGYKNAQAVPRLVKVVVNVGLGEALLDKKVIDKVKEQLAVITGQKAVTTAAKRSISNFKLRAGEIIGLKVTLRSTRMYDFFEKLVNIVLPRVRDFRGMPKKRFDGRGNYTLGLKEQIVFPELEYGQIDKTRGLEITIVTTGKTDEDAYKLLSKLGMPFEKES